MQENKQDKYEFISEKIKDKPVNKKKLTYHVCVVVLLAVLFGIVASVTFVLCQPKIDGMLHPQEDPTITIPKDEPEQETETEDPDTETETNEPDSEPQIVYEQLTLRQRRLPAKINVCLIHNYDYIAVVCNDILDL